MKRFKYLFVVLLAFGLVAAACGDDAATTTEAPTTTEAAAEETTIIIGTTDAISSLDSADAYATADWELIKAFNEPLLRFTPGSNSVLEPGIASLPVASEDGLSWTVTLR
ncbi:MAG: hypothetical protein KJ956_00980, partial [Actinobacteria bacterium]|nr:hypothetical protein [Actinomycetota bacterium]